jgi:hypothetical protein
VELEVIKPPSEDEVGIAELLELDFCAGGMTGTEVVELPDEGKRALVTSEGKGKIPEVGTMLIELEDDCVDSGTLMGIVGRSSKPPEVLEDVGVAPVEVEDWPGKRPSRRPNVLVDVGPGVFEVEDEDVPSRPANKLPEVPVVVDVAPVVVLVVDDEESPPRPKLRSIRGSDEVEVAVGDV